MSEPQDFMQASAMPSSEPVAVFEFEFSESFFVEMFDRYRRTTSSPRFMFGLRVVFAPLLLVCAVWSAVNGFMSGAFVAGVFGLLLISPDKLDEWVLRRGFRKSPFRNEPVRVELGREGIRSAGNVSTVSLKWPAFTGVQRFADGFLLFQGPQVFNWLPVRCLKSGSIEAIEQLLREKISEYRKV